jgi:hypothetical protein
MKPRPGRRIQIHIEELVLEDLVGADRIGDAIRRELSRHVGDQRWSWRDRGFTTIDSVDAGEITIAKHASAAAHGRAIARAAFRALQQARSGPAIHGVGKRSHRGRNR